MATRIEFGTMMPTTPIGPDYPNDLRAKAQSLLLQGDPPSSLGDGLSPDALAVLFKLAGSAESAGDGLKLLHELQTHQIELDLQHEQSKINEHEMAVELSRYKALYEFAPAGYFILNREGYILDSNKAGADLLGMPYKELTGCLFENHLASESRSILSWKLKKLFSSAAQQFDGTARETCTLHTIVKVHGSDSSLADNTLVHAVHSMDSRKAQTLLFPALRLFTLRLVARLAPEGDRVFVNIVEAEIPQPS